MSEIDEFIGAKLKLRRSQLNITQGALARAVETTYHAIILYEKGTRQIPYLILKRISVVLDVSITFFFDDMHIDEIGTLVQLRTICGLLNSEGQKIMLRLGSKLLNRK